MFSNVLIEYVYKYTGIKCDCTQYEYNFNYKNTDDDDDTPSYIKPSSNTKKYNIKKKKKIK
jgi:hypothetical protein